MNRQARHDNIIIKINYKYWTVFFTAKLSPKYIVIVLFCCWLLWKTRGDDGWWRAKVFANGIRLSDQLTVLEEDILLDRKGAWYVRYLSSGMECGVHVVAADSGQSLKIQQTEEEEEEGLLLWICQMLQTGRNWFLYFISSSAVRLQYAYIYIYTYKIWPQESDNQYAQRSR